MRRAVLGRTEGSNKGGEGREEKNEWEQEKKQGESKDNEDIKCQRRFNRQVKKKYGRKAGADGIRRGTKEQMKRERIVHWILEMINALGH